MAIIFSKLDKTHTPLAILCSWLGGNIYYVDIETPNDVQKVVSKLEGFGVRPLPVETLEHIESAQLYLGGLSC